MSRWTIYLFDVAVLVVIGIAIVINNAIDNGQVSLLIGILVGTISSAILDERREFRKRRR